MVEYIKKIIYINLEHRVDRKEEIEIELNKYGLLSERYNATFNNKNGIGSLTSHLGVLKNAKKNAYKNVLILEDDFMFNVDKDEFNAKIALLFNTIDFDVCMLSYNLIHGDLCKEHPFLTRVYDAHNAGGYLVNESIYDQLIELYEYALPLLEHTGEHWNYTNDQIWKRLQKTAKWYCFTERLGIQRSSFSDNVQRFVTIKW